MHTVLLVEDTEDNRFMLRRLLEMSGYDVLEAQNGREAVKLAIEEQPDLILMDLSLPVIDGLAATRLIRKNTHMNETPIVAVSAHALPRDIEQAKSAGCLEYITKPITEDPFSFLERITRIMLAGQHAGVRCQESGDRSQASG